MLKPFLHLIMASTLGMMLLIGAFASPASAASEGTVQTLRIAGASFNEFTSAPSAASQAWMSSHFWRMIVYSPYFDSRTSWYPNGWAYKDAFAIYPGTPVSEHSDWIFRDAAGHRLYIPFACSGGRCPQYAGNIANAGFRQHWIEEARATLAHGYRGLYIDDVDMEFRVSNGEGTQVSPIDPTTGQAMTYAAWRQYMAQFMEQIRSALPGVEIIHNVIWFADWPARISDPYIQREIESASGVYLERGVNDGGLVGGSGQWSLGGFLSYAEGVNALGRFFVMGDGAASQQARVYDLANYLLLSNGSDAIDVGSSTPNEWWSGWEIQLGHATDARYSRGGLQRRDFTDGVVLVNEPGGATQTIALPTAMIDANSNTVTSVTLPASSGSVLRNVPPKEEGKKPPKEEGKPPKEEGKPPKEEGKPPKEEGKPPKEEGKPPPKKAHRSDRRRKKRRRKRERDAAWFVIPIVGKPW